ncbi:type II toxin-antitoxin system prevent-host-death family antitoxin [Acidisoma cellulosilytica]|uniref:Antitoxin n=1 Tax=Acidisoma cellulosilyticum TaxID=2802395 RepID=A0A963Z2X3_9PROT|nr:type II toxin-antitoxin system prevent-host-death family antitoxin [Acidisoma cellulosilyticum]MCB8881631.1 type II toxin-antitoxin system prevent-host-death family antitoxin [Acidisoma cellulosilyticum]
MKIAVSDAKAQLLELVRRAEKGEEVILTRRGEAIARLVSLAPDGERRLAALARARGAAKDGLAAKDAEDLYDDHGLPV